MLCSFGKYMYLRSVFLGTIGFRGHGIYRTVTIPTVKQRMSASHLGKTRCVFCLVNIQDQF